MEGQTDVNLYTPAPLFQSGGIITRYDKLSSICIPKMSILVCIVVEKSLMKYVILQSMDRKKNWTNTGKNKQEKAGSHPTIKQVIINLHTKYENSSLNGS